MYIDNRHSSSAGIMTQQQPKKRVSPFGLVMPPQMREYLERQASLYRRPMTQEILMRLEQTIAQEQKGAQQ